MPVISLPSHESKKSARRPRTGVGFPAVLLPLILAIGAYAGSWGHDFVYDDVYVILDNEVLHSLGNIWAVLTAPWWPANALYRPVTMLTFAIDWAVSGGAAPYFHVVNTLLHVLCTYLVYRFARLMIPLAAAIVAAALFAVHPVHVEAVANVVGRAEVLATIFTLAAALLYARDGDERLGGRSNRERWLSGSAIAAMALLAFGSKESALALPGVLWIVDWIVAHRKSESFSDRLHRHWQVLVVTLFLAAGWILTRVLLLGDVAGDHPGPGIFGENFWGRLTNMAPVVLEWVRLLIFPLHLSADYSPYYLPAGWGVRAFAGIGVVLFLTIAGIVWRKRYPEVSFGLAWLGGTLLVVANILVPTGVLLAERSLYLPSVGFCLIVGWAVSRVRMRRAAVVPAAAALVIGLGLARTIVRVPVWKDPTSFFPRLVQDAPGSFRSYWVAGAIAYQRGDRAMGEQLMRSAITIYPLFPNVWNSLAIELEADERWKEAGDLFSAAFRIDPTRVQDAVSATSNYIRGGELDSATAVVERALGAGTDDFRLKILQAEIEIAEGRPENAVVLRREVADSRPDVWQYWYLTAEAAVRAGDCSAAVASMDRVGDLIDEIDDSYGVESAIDSLNCR